MTAFPGNGEAVIFKTKKAMKTILKTLLTSALLILFYLSAATQITNSSGTFQQKEVVLETATGSIYGQLMLPDSKTPVSLDSRKKGRKIGIRENDINSPKISIQHSAFSIQFDPPLSV